MRRPVFFFLIFLFSLSCQSPGTDRRINHHSSGFTGEKPFDRHLKLVYTRHARCRMDCRHISDKEIHEILDDGTINYAKSEPEANPGPKYAIEGFTTEKQHLRIIIAPEKEKLVVITCIELGVEWTCHCN